MMIQSIVAAAFLTLAACGGSAGDISDRASKAAEATCACTTFECTKEQMAALNKMSIKEKDAVAKLPTEKAEVYKAAQSKAADCQQKLREQK